MHDVFEGADRGIVELCYIVGDVIVEVYFYICVCGLIWEASGGAIVPVPSVGTDNCLLVRKFGAVDDYRTSGLDETDGLEKLLLVFGSPLLEAEPR